ncbi:MbtH protein [Micromonospora pallida]|uniref:MbtH protein n=1 Tax=Micromonospora pallida TaxID=145854 RepID=A0A1C6S849_9ACTN|nr:MbtH family NRPS accessory protein [Micromonospora pallida]SCL25657.1 MbtH protein [Micromonospora pallida]
MDNSEDLRRYQVVVNDEEQYSIWLEGSEIPAGWSPVGITGDRVRCLAYIDEVWTDLRPRSLRERLTAQG